MLLGPGLVQHRWESTVGATLDALPLLLDECIAASGGRWRGRRWVPRLPKSFELGGLAHGGFQRSKVLGGTGTCISVGAVQALIACVSL